MKSASLINLFLACRLAGSCVYDMATGFWAATDAIGTHTPHDSAHSVKALQTLSFTRAVSSVCEQSSAESGHGV